MGEGESASGDTALAESDGRELRGGPFAKSQSGVGTSFCRRTPYNAALPNVYRQGSRKALQLAGLEALIFVSFYLRAHTISGLGSQLLSVPPDHKDYATDTHKRPVRQGLARQVRPRGIQR